MVKTKGFCILKTFCGALRKKFCFGGPLSSIERCNSSASERKRAGGGGGGGGQVDGNLLFENQTDLTSQTTLTFPQYIQLENICKVQTVLVYLSLRRL